MDEALLLSDTNSNWREKWSVLWEEMKKLGYLAGPMAAVTLSFYMIQVISLMMVGHLGKLYLSSTALAISFATVSGFSFLVCIFPLSVFVFVFAFVFENPN